MVFRASEVNGKFEGQAGVKPGQSRAQAMESGEARAEAQAADQAAKDKAARQAKQQADARTSMSMFDYQSGAVTTAIYPGAGTGDLRALAYLFSLLASEAGEANGKFGKLLRDGETKAGEAREAVAYELGDVMWAVAQIANELNYSLSDIAKMNLDKLADRKARGVLGGSGDTR